MGKHTNSNISNLFQEKNPQTNYNTDNNFYINNGDATTGQRRSKSNTNIELKSNNLDEDYSYLDNINPILSPNNNNFLQTDFNSIDNISPQENNFKSIENMNKLNEFLNKSNKYLQQNLNYDINIYSSKNDFSPEKINLNSINHSPDENMESCVKKTIPNSYINNKDSKYEEDINKNTHIFESINSNRNGLTTNNNSHQQNSNKDIMLMNLNYSPLRKNNNKNSNKNERIHNYNTTNDPKAHLNANCENFKRNLGNPNNNFVTGNNANSNNDFPLKTLTNNESNKKIVYKANITNVANNFNKNNNYINNNNLVENKAYTKYYSENNSNININNNNIKLSKEISLNSQENTNKEKYSEVSIASKAKLANENNLEKNNFNNNFISNNKKNFSFLPSESMLAKQINKQKIANYNLVNSLDSENNFPKSQETYQRHYKPQKASNKENSNDSSFEELKNLENIVYIRSKLESKKNELKELKIKYDEISALNAEMMQQLSELEAYKNMISENLKNNELEFEDKEKAFINKETQMMQTIKILEEQKCYFEEKYNIFSSEERIKENEMELLKQKIKDLELILDENDNE